MINSPRSHKLIKAHDYLGIFIAIIYVVVYDYIIRTFMFDMFAYMLKYDYHSMSVSLYLIYIFICVFPLLFYKGFVSIASIISFFCYLLVYIPFIHTLFVAHYPGYMTVLYVCFFAVAQIFFFLTDSLQIGLHVFPKTNRISFEFFEIICAFLMLILVVINFNEMHMVNIFDQSQKNILYEIREENRASSFGINDYLMGWMNHVLLPILLVSYLNGRKYLKFILAFICMILVFMMDMQKISFLIPFIIFLFFCLYKYFSSFYVKYFHIILLISLIVLPLFAISNLNSSFGFTLAAMLVMRTQCVEGRQFAAYFDFFEIKGNPYTYFSHIKIIDKLTGLYPYDTSLGYMVSYGDANSNATFYLMDGIAGFGFIGCVLVALLFIILKSFLNTIGNNYDDKLCVIILFFVISSLMNSSIFTSFITGGILLFYIVCRVVDLKSLRKLL